MTSLAARERRLYCAAALQAGPQAPTLCGEWTVRDLTIHLLVREGGLAGIGIFVPPLARLAQRATARYAEADFETLVDQVRNGPPTLSPFSLPPVNASVNLAEFYVHHEDILRAPAEQTPRVVDDEMQKALWKLLKVGGRAVALKAPGGLRVRNAATGAEVTLKGGKRPVTVTGSPSEVILYCYGRQKRSIVDVQGDPAAVSAMATAALGI